MHLSNVCFVFKFFVFHVKTKKQTWKEIMKHKTMADKLLGLPVLPFVDIIALLRALCVIGSPGPGPDG